MEKKKTPKTKRVNAETAVSSFYKALDHKVANTTTIYFRNGGDVVRIYTLTNQPIVDIPMTLMNKIYQAESRTIKKFSGSFDFDFKVSEKKDVRAGEMRAVGYKRYVPA